MTLDGIFRGIGDVMQATFTMLQNDIPITFAFNTFCVLLGFFGLFYWLRIQKKLTAKAKAQGTLD